MFTRLVLALALGSLGGAAVADTTVNRGGTVTMTASRQGVLIANFNPFSPKALHSTFGPLYEPLVFANAHHARIEPWLARQWQWSDDLLQLTLDLQTDVRWHDGQTLDADDVVFTLMLGKDDAALDQAGLWKQGLEQVERVDADSVALHFSEVNTTLLPRLGNIYILPEHIWRDIDDPISHRSETDPVGSGPFLASLDSFSEQTYTMEKNPDYWQQGTDGEPLPYIDAVRYLSVTGNEQGAMRIIAGDIDWGTYFIANIDRTFVRRDKEHNHYWLPEGNLVYLNFNNAKAPFDQRELRRAISMAINPAQITRVMNSGAMPAPPSGLKQNHLSWLPDAAQSYRLSYDPVQALDQLEALGYAPGEDGILARDGERLSFDLYVPSGWTDWVTAVDVISRQLREIGIEARVSQVAWPSPFLTNIADGSYDISIDYVSYGFSPYYQFDNMLAERHYAPIGETSDSSHSHMRYRNEEVDKALSTYRQTNDETTRRAAMNTVLTAVARDTPMMPLFFNPVWFQYTTRRFEGWPNADDPYVAPKTARMDKMPVLLRLQPVGAE